MPIVESIAQFWRIFKFYATIFFSRLHVVIGRRMIGRKLFILDKGLILAAKNPARLSDISGRVLVLASGSSGNCTFIQVGNAKILVDIGISCSRIESALCSIGVDPYDIDAVFITHEHSDHISGLDIFTSRYHRKIVITASKRTDMVNIKGDFPHKTAATRAGLGWIGRHCQLVTRKFGLWIRLGTVFTDMTIPCGQPVERDSCGRCTRCVDACPAGALTGNAWYPGLPREDILDTRACDSWKIEHYFKYLKGHTCGICSAVCPHGLKVLKKSDQSRNYKAEDSR